jgi:hypothetical protein
MAFYIRKIDLGKWMQNKGVTDHTKLSADVITNCLKTTENKLSLWKIDTIDKLNETLIAITSGMEHLDRIAIVFFEDEKLNNDLSLEVCAGRTPFSKFKNNHCDIVKLNYDSLGKFSKVVQDAIIENKYKQISRLEIIELLNKAISEHKLNIPEISEHVKKKLAMPAEVLQ